MIHRHCEERAPPCKAQIESGSYVTMSRKKVVKGLEDLDELAQFLLEKVSGMTHRDPPAARVLLCVGFARSSVGTPGIGSETAQTNSLFRMIPHVYYHLVDTSALDYDCIYQFVNTASLVPQQLVGLSQLMQMSYDIT